MMRRILTKEETEKVRKRNATILGIILIGLMVLSTLGYAFFYRTDNGASNDNGQQKIKYNGLEFTYNNGFWFLGSFAFQYNPTEVPDYGAGLNNATHYQNKSAYVYSDSPSAETELKVNLGQISSGVQSVCVQGLPCTETKPLKTCEDNLIIIRESENTSISQKNNCVYIEGKKDDLVKLTDQFLFKIFGIK